MNTEIPGQNVANNESAIEERRRESKLRRMAKRNGLYLMKSRTRNPAALDFGCFMIFDSETRFVVCGAGWNGRGDLSLDDVECYLNGISEE
jgi:hypothetical protein